MNLDDYVIGEHDFSDKPKRQLRTGHSLAPQNGSILCKCGWSITIAPPMDREEAEEVAWLHVSQPQLILKGSSDTLLAGRLARLPKDGRV